MRPLLYLAHPVRAATLTGYRANLASAREYLDAMLSAGLLVIAPWLAELELYDDSDEAQREAGLQRACEIVARCDGIVACGYIVTDGMRRELVAAERAGVRYIHCLRLMPRDAARHTVGSVILWKDLSEGVQ